MTLVLRTAKGAVSFEWSDDDAETVVKIEPTDTDEVMLRKLKRVVTLAEGSGFTPFTLPMTDRNPTGLALPAQTGNGWAAVAPVVAPELPEDRQGEWELIKPGEEDV